MKDLPNKFEWEKAQRALDDANHAVEVADKAVLVAQQVVEKAARVAANQDHDTLVAFRAETIAELKNIRTDIQNLNDNTAGKLEDHEQRIRINTDRITKLWSYGAALLFLTSIVQFLLSRYWK